jgi:ribosomal RNA-processing protein 36
MGRAASGKGRGGSGGGGGDDVARAVRRMEAFDATDDEGEEEEEEEEEEDDMTRAIRRMEAADGSDEEKGGGGSYYSESDESEQQEVEEQRSRAAEGAKGDESGEEEDEEEDLPLGSRLAQMRHGGAQIAKRGGATRKGKIDVPRRSNKNRPMELPSKFPVKRHRVVVSSSGGHRARDPRFDDAGGGKLDHNIFRKAYGFLEDYQNAEIDAGERSIKRSTTQVGKRKRPGALSGEELEETSAEVRRMKQERAERSRAFKLREALQARKRDEAAAVSKGKKAWYLKSSDKRKIATDQRYEELKSSNKLQKYITKKRKHNAARDHRWLPTRRTAEPP